MSWSVSDGVVGQTTAWLALAGHDPTERCHHRRAWPEHRRDLDRPPHDDPEADERERRDEENLSLTGDVRSLAVGAVEAVQPRPGVHLGALVAPEPDGGVRGERTLPRDAIVRPVDPSCQVVL